MAGLTGDRNTKYKEGTELPFPGAAASKIYGGNLVKDSAAGYAIPGADTAGCVFAGVANENVDNSGGAAGAKKIRLRRKGAFEFDCSGITQADLNKDVYLVDDHTVGLAATTTNDVPCGRIVEVISSAKVMVDIKVK